MMTWLHRLRLWQKFLLLGALALVMAAIPATLYLSRVTGDVDAARQRAEGAVSAIALQKVIRNAQFHRGVVAASMSEESSLASLWREDNDALAEQRPAARAALMQSLGDFGERLKAMTPSPAFVADWQDAGQRWASLDSDLSAGGIKSADRSTELHSEWIGALLGLSDRLVDEYGLTRTPEPASHALVGTVFVHMPRIAEVLGQLRALGAVVVANRELPQESRTALTYREQLLGAALADLDRSLSFVRASDPQLAGKLGPRMAQMKESIAAATGLIDREILESGQIFLASDEYFRTMTATIDQVYAFDEETAAALTGLFTANVTALRRGLAAAGGVLVLMAALGAALTLAFVRSVTMPLREAIAFAGRVADGDLGTTLQARGSNEIGQLVTVLGQMRMRIADVVGTVREQAEGVAVASAQIAQGNADLSARTEQQASALQQTAAAMEELSTTVQQNADHAQQADGHARQAGEVAATGGRVVDDVVGTMKEINESSRRIAEIVSVIDGIAFQTNILALNAAVEAARAGEQGRGFAVVAGEVRSLAQRSADAAREVKRLIDTSVERVDRGSELAARAGATMQEIVTSIQRVSGIVGEISNASAEQSAGVGQVRDAVTDLDRNTQHNAALVEESAAAAAALRTQSRDLVQAVAVFRLESAEEPMAPAERERSGRPHRRQRTALEAGSGAPMESAAADEAARGAPADAGFDPAAVTVERRGPNRATNVSRLPQSSGRGRGAGGEAQPSEAHDDDDEAPDALRA